MGNMKDWHAFALSGKVEDYLRYAAGGLEEGGCGGKEKKGKGQETDTYAGFVHGDRTHTEGGTHRGI